MSFPFFLFAHDPIGKPVQNELLDSPGSVDLPWAK